MTLPKPGDGLGIIFQGYDCALPFSYPRSVGLEPDIGFVHLLQEDFKNFTIKEGIAGVDARARQNITVERGPGAQQQQPGEGFLSAGTLIIREQLDGKPVGETVYQQVVLTERSVETPVVVETNNLVRIELTDMRYLWSTRGCLTFRMNVLPEGAAGDLGAVATVVDVAEAIPPEQFEPGSLRNGAAPWTLKQALEEKILPALPGSPRLHRISRELENRVPLTHIWDAVLPKVALKDLMQEFKFLVALNPDSSISIWAEGDGVPQDMAGNAVPGPIQSNIRPNLAYHHVPRTVIVIGPPIVRMVRIGLEPVGISKETGQYIDAFKAAQEHGLDRALALGFAAASVEQRAALYGLDEAGVAELDEWFGKYWRLPGGQIKNKHRLPMLLNRPTISGGGRKDPPKLFVQTVQAVNVAALQKNGANGPIQKAALAAARQAKHPIVVINLPIIEAHPSSFQIDTEQGLVKFRNVIARAQEVTAATGTKLDGLGTVDIEYAYIVKPRVDEESSLDHRFFAVFENRGGRAERIDGIPPGTAPFKIDRPDLQLVIDVDGRSNRGVLEQSAANAAQAQFDRPKATIGGVLQLHRPFPCVCTGFVRSVIHTTESKLPRVFIHIGSKEPTAVPPEPQRTIERDPRSFDGVQGTNVTAPTGHRSIFG